MSDKNKKDEDIVEETSSNTKAYFYVGLGSLVLSAVGFGLTFVEGIGIYALIVSVLLSLGALSFFQTQKKKNKFNLIKYFEIAAYVVLGAALLLFIGGLIYSATLPKDEAYLLLSII